MVGRPRRGRRGADAAQFVRRFGMGAALGCSACCRSACWAIIAARLSSALPKDPSRRVCPASGCQAPRPS